MATCARSAPLRASRAAASAGAARPAAARRAAPRCVAAAAGATAAADVDAWNAAAKTARLAALEAEAMGAIKHAVESFDHPVFPCAFIAGPTLLRCLAHLGMVSRWIRISFRRSAEVTEAHTGTLRPQAGVVAKPFEG